VGHLNLSAGVPNFKKCIISFWFRIPGSTARECRATYEATPVDPYHPGTGGTPQYQPVSTHPLHGVVPLLTFGPKPASYVPATVTTSSGSSIGTIYSLNFSTCALTATGSTDDQGSSSSTTTHTVGQNYIADPCYIGVDCTDPKGDGKYWLKVNIQTDVYPTAHAWEHVDHTFTSTASFKEQSVVSQITTAPPPTSEAGWGYDPIPALPVCGQWAFSPGAENVSYTGRGWYDVPVPGRTTTNTATDTTSFANLAKPEQMGATSKTIEVTLDHWHHIILSLDLSGSVSAVGSWGTGGIWGLVPPTYTAGSWDSNLLMYCAFDDVNYTRGDLPSLYMAPGSGSGGSPQGSGRPDNSNPNPNAIMTASVYKMFTQDWSYPVGNPGAPVMGSGSAFYAESGSFSGAYTDGPPTTDFALSTGLHTHDLNFGFPATPELSDAILDVDMAEFQMWTGNTIDPNEESLRRLFVTSGGRPVPPKTAEKTLGRPLILLHKTGNWIKGKNTGTSGQSDLSDPSTIIPAGQFDPVMTIKKYVPDPSLRGPQGKPTAAITAEAEATQEAD